MAKQRHVQATPGVGSVNFRTVVFGGALFKWSSCVLRVLCDTWGLRCVMFTFCDKEAEWGRTAFVAYLVLGFQNSTQNPSACTMHSVPRKQHPCPSNTGCIQKAASMWRRRDTAVPTHSGAHVAPPPPCVSCTSLTRPLC